jgi:hypothetical protein
VYAGRYRSGARGAKQLDVVKTQRMESGPNSAIFRSSAGRSVRTSSPSNRFGIATGMNPTRSRAVSHCVCFVVYVRVRVRVVCGIPAVWMDLRHDFWSIRGHKT